MLAASSDYFYAMSRNGMKESNQEVIELKDESIPSNALKIILEFCTRKSGYLAMLTHCFSVQSNLY